jgi:hypothetical protein
MDQEEILQELQGREPRPALTPAGVYRPELAAEIAALPLPVLAKIGLHLLNDDLNTSHRLAQSLEGDPTADYWHAIIHRREGDYGNARYWFARVGSHPVVLEIYGDPPTASRFVDKCRAAEGEEQAPLEELQWCEMLRLLDYAL